MTDTCGHPRTCNFWRDRFLFGGCCIGILVLIVCYLAATYLEPTISGAGDARRDYARGHYEVKQLGTRKEPWFNDCTRLLKERYGVGVSVIEPDFSGRTFYYAGAYNNVSMAQLKKRFEKDILRE
jgi:hypothetical protein